MSCFGYELVFIHALSLTKKTFVIRLGKANGIVSGLEGTFTTPYISMMAKAEAVTREYSQWRVLEPGAEIPFEKNQLVTFHPSPEGVWMHDPQAFLFLVENGGKEVKPNSEEVKALLETSKELSIFAKPELPPLRSVSLKAFFFQGLSQTVSLTNSSQIFSRQGNHFLGLYETRIWSGFFIGGGLRLDQEYVDSSTVITTSQRTFLLFDVSYQFKLFKNFLFSTLYIGTTTGIGLSQTEVAHEKLHGQVTLFPAGRVGLELPFPYEYCLQVEGGAEAIAIREKFSDGDQQTTNEVNWNAGVGIKKYF